MGFSLLRLASLVRLVRPFGLATFAFIGCASFGEGRDAAPTPTPLDGGDDAPASDASSIDGDPLPATDASPRVDGGCEKVFEEHFTTAFQFPWVTAQSSGGAVEHSVSGGRDGGGLRAKITSNGGSNDAQISRSDPGAFPQSAMLTYVTRIAAASGDYFEVGCTLQLRGTNTNSHVSFQLELKNGELSLDDNAKYMGADYPTDAGVKLGAPNSSDWYAIRLELHDIEATRCRAVGFVGATKRFEGILRIPEPPKEVRVKCGIDYGAPAGMAEVYVDDVRLDVCR